MEGEASGRARPRDDARRTARRRPSLQEARNAGGDGAHGRDAGRAPFSRRAAADLRDVVRRPRRHDTPNRAEALGRLRKVNRQGAKAAKVSLYFPPWRALAPWRFLTPF